VPLQSLYLPLDSCRYSTSQFHQPPTSRPPTRASRSSNLPNGSFDAKKIQMPWILSLLWRLGLMQTLVWLHQSALPAGIPPLFTSLPMTCVGRLRVRSMVIANTQPSVHTPTPECLHPPPQHRHFCFNLVLDYPQYPTTLLIRLLRKPSAQRSELTLRLCRENR
jgi:hypothetical protein